MKEIIFYKEEENNLCSIKSVENNKDDEEYFFNLIDSLLKKSKYLITVNRRLQYKLNINSFNYKNCVKDFKETKHYLSFNIKCKEINYEIDYLRKIMWDIWINYEQPTFIFIEKILDKVKIDFLQDANNMLSWGEITNISESFVIFKGIEEDVIWIGKSKQLKF